VSNVRFDFTGRTALVTGGARGIGLEVARRLQDAGARTYVFDFDAQAVTQAANEIGAMAIAGDVAAAADADAAISRAVDESGRIDILVNNAGILRDRVLWKLSDEDWDDVIRVHLGGMFRMTRAAIPHFRRQGHGRIVNVTSYTGLRGNIGQANYAAAKSGVLGFTKTAAKELARFGITVNVISPNAETRMVSSVPPEKRAELIAAIPLGRFADPSEIAAAVAFLCSEEAGYITGTVLPVDGGLAI
jgi:3-oxoacyl-[acyl-carrier protein] reductase